MRKSRFTETQIVSILKAADAGMRVKEICRKHGISAPTYFRKCRKLLRRQGKLWNHKRIYRVYTHMRLHLRRAAKRRLPKRHRVELYVPSG